MKLVRVNLQKKEPPRWRPIGEQISNWTCMAALVGICWGGCHYISKSDHETAANCSLAHHDQPYTEEKLFAVTQSGCKVIQVDKFKSTCYPDKTLYVTDCRGVNWSESHGKSGTTDEGTVNQ